MPLHQRAKFISSVTQETNTGTVLEMTLLENIVLSLLRGKKSYYYRCHRHLEAARKVLATLGLGFEDRLHHKLYLFSGGQRQIIALLMALWTHPKLLLLDEHTSALDPQTQNKLMAFTVAKIKENKITTLMITHNLQHAMTYGDRLIVLREGKIIVDVKGKEKSQLTNERCLNLFYGCHQMGEENDARLI